MNDLHEISLEKNGNVYNYVDNMIIGAVTESECQNILSVSVSQGFTTENLATSPSGCYKKIMASGNPIYYYNRHANSEVSCDPETATATNSKICLYRYSNSKAGQSNLDIVSDSTYGAQPPARHQHGTLKYIDPQTNIVKMIIFGGKDKDGDLLKDLWSMDVAHLYQDNLGSKFRWTEQGLSKYNGMPAIAKPMIFNYLNYIYVYGGIDANGITYNTMWRIEYPNGREWEQVIYNEGSPEAGAGHAYGVKGKHFYLMGSLKRDEYDNAGTWDFTQS